MIQIEEMEESMKNTNKLTILILAAGYGRRMGPFSRMINKSLVPYNNKPLISHIIDKFPKDSKFIIACGHEGQQVKDYLENVHKEKNISYVDIPNFNEDDTGPATSIRQCASVLPDKFLWITCDTLFEFDYEDKLDHSWIAVSPVDSSISEDYCWIKRDGNKIVETRNKEKSNKAVDAFIGLMYLNDRRFLNKLIDRDAKDVYTGFDNIDLHAYTVKQWQDFGTYEKWQEISEGLPEVSFPKPDELFFHDNNKVIKFTTNKTLAKLKYNRAILNPDCMPKNIVYTDHFLFYDYAPGEIFYNYLTPSKFELFLSWAKNKLWKDSFYISQDANDRFYRLKTLERLEKFRIKYNTWAEFNIVNGTQVKSINDYLDTIDFDWLAKDTRWTFIHGDMQFDNIICNNNKFTAIDWRTDFAGEMYGDIYYDLAKMLGGLYLNYKMVKQHDFEYYEMSNRIWIEIPAVDDIEIYEAMLESWVINNSLNWKKVKTLVPLIYLNMAPLHEAPFDKFLIALSQLHFSQL